MFYRFSNFMFRSFRLVG